jgi:hypothetical protein
MYIHIALRPVLALIAGLVVVLIPRLERYAVGAYLITIGLLGIFGR